MVPGGPDPEGVFEAPEQPPKNEIRWSVVRPVRPWWQKAAFLAGSIGGGALAVTCALLPIWMPQPYNYGLIWDLRIIAMMATFVAVWCWFER
jgi:hypothetical protein